MERNTLESSPPAVWPNYSELARIVHMSTSGFGRFVRGWPGRVTIRSIGRERRVAPASAIALLEARGIPDAVAEREVGRLLEERMASVSVLAGPSLPSTDEQLLEELSSRYRSVIAKMRQPGFDRALTKLFLSTDTPGIRRAADRRQRSEAVAERHA